jgi:hypothetical protein
MASIPETDLARERSDIGVVNWPPWPDARHRAIRKTTAEKTANRVGGDLRVHPHIRHDHSGEGVADEHRRARLRRDRPPRGLRRFARRTHRPTFKNPKAALLLDLETQLFEALALSKDRGLRKSALRFGEACAIHKPVKGTNPRAGSFPDSPSALLPLYLDINEPDRVLVNGEIDSNYGSFLAHHKAGLVG